MERRRSTASDAGFCEKRCNVEYSIDQLKVSRSMTQGQLADLLKNDRVNLVSVNAPKSTGYRKTAYKKKGVG